MSLKALFSLCIVLLVAQIHAHAQEQRDLTPEEANAWRSIESARLTPDGKWFVYRLTTPGKPTQVIMRSMQDKTERRYEAGMGGGEPLKISPSGKWIGFVIAAVPPARSGMAIVEVASGRREDFAEVQTLTFAGFDRGEWAALHAYPKETPKSVEPSLGAESAKVKRTCPSRRLYPGYCESGPEPAILTLRELGSARSERLANVEAFAFNPSGTQLAWINAAGVQLLTLASGKTRLLDAQARARYRELAWSERGHGLAFMRTQEPSDTAMLVFTQLPGSLKKRVFTPANLPRFPGGYEISPNAMPAPIGMPYYGREALVWREDEAGLFLGIRLIHRPAAATRLTADGKVVLWHGQDARLPSRKEQDALADQKFSYLSFLSLKTGQFVQLADARLPYVDPQRRGRYVLGFDRATDLLADTRLILRRNYSLVDIDSGAQHRVLRNLRIAYFVQHAPHPKLSPDGTSLVYVDLENGGHYKVYDVASGEYRNLTASLPNAFFERHELKSEVLVRAFLTFPAIQGWADDGAYVLVSDYFDVWALPLKKGGQAKRLTPDGQAKHIQYYVYTDLVPRGDEQLTAYVYNHNYLPNQYVSTPIVRLDQPMYFAADDDQSWQTGLGLYTQSRFEMLQWEDAEMSYQKARQANVFVASRATSVEFPNYHRVDRNWQVSERLTDANPVQREVRWSPRAQLISYRSPAGHALQAILHRPLGYEAGNAYPTIVTVYEKQDWMLNRYSPPNQDVGLWTQHGYAVLQASIEHRTGEIARSSAEDVLAGIDAAARTGDIDTEKLGLRGHSFGGFGTGAIATQTSIFKVAFATSGDFDWYSACRGIYGKWLPSESACAHSQPRMGGRWWEQWSAYGKNSPLYSATALQTPLLLAHGDEDPLVSFSQSVGLFNVMRSLGNRPVVLLQTKGAGHEGINEEGEKMALALFDHFLKGAAAPRWWSQGVSYY